MMEHKRQAEAEADDDPCDCARCLACRELGQQLFALIEAWGNAQPGLEQEALEDTCGVLAGLAAACIKALSELDPQAALEVAEMAIWQEIAPAAGHAVRAGLEQGRFRVESQPGSRFGYIQPVAAN